MVDLELGPLRFGVIGAGRLGILLARGLQQAGFELVAASSNSTAGCERASHALGIPVFTDPGLVLGDIDVLLICVPDDAVEPMAARLAAEHAQQAKGLRIVHTSGCISVEALGPLADAGADTLSLHPLQTVTHGSVPADLRGAAAAVTATDDAGRTFGHALAHALGMTPFDLPDQTRALYHAASAFAANFTVTLLAAARDVCQAAGVDENVARHAFAALARSATLRVEREGPEAALTGPIVRGDTGTIERHLAALDAELPGAAQLYRELSDATTRLAVNAGRVDVETARRLGEIMSAETPTPIEGE